MATRKKLHCTTCNRDIRQSNPGGENLISRLQPPVRRILVPGHKVSCIRFLDEKVGHPTQNIRADDRLNVIQDFRLTNKFIRPGKQQMSLMTHCRLQRTAQSVARVLPTLTCTTWRQQQKSQAAERKNRHAESGSSSQLHPARNETLIKSFSIAVIRQ